MLPLFILYPTIAEIKKQFLKDKHLLCLIPCPFHSSTVSTHIALCALDIIENALQIDPWGTLRYTVRSINRFLGLWHKTLGRRPEFAHTVTLEPAGRQCTWAELIAKACMSPSPLLQWSSAKKSLSIIIHLPGKRSVWVSNRLQHVGNLQRLLESVRVSTVSGWCRNTYNRRGK